MQTIDLYPHQARAVSEITKAFRYQNKCLVKMFCGTGKTRIAFHMMMTVETGSHCYVRGKTHTSSSNLAVIVFPSISLVTQYNSDYINNPEWNDLSSQFVYLSICSKNELKETDEQATNKIKIKYTTDETVINEFLTNDGHDRSKIICVTYQSLDTFVDCLTKTTASVGLIIYDEAHHIIGNNAQQLVFNNEQFQKRCQKTLFLTATPKNDNGIKMLDRNFDDIDLDDIDAQDFRSNIPYYSDCGKLVYEYTHHQAVQDGICNNFNIYVDIYEKESVVSEKSDRCSSMYAAISRCIFQTGHTRCMTFHNRAEVKSEKSSNVRDFTNKEAVQQFKEIYEQVLDSEFPHLKERYSQKLNVIGLTSKTKNKKAILQAFDQAGASNEVTVLSSCNTIGEGVDTKAAGIICFVDPRTSYSMIIQNIGRVCRKQEQTSAVLVPCAVDPNRQNQNSTHADCLLDEDLTESGCFGGVLTLLSALRQDDPAMYNLCLRYPNKYAPVEIRDNLLKYGYKIGAHVGGLIQTVEHLTKITDLDIESAGVDDCVSMQQIAQIVGHIIELHTNSMDRPVQQFIPTNGEHKSIVRLYYNDTADEYRPITKINKDAGPGSHSGPGSHTKTTTQIQIPHRRKININVHVTRNDHRNTTGWWKDLKTEFVDKICAAHIEICDKHDVSRWKERLNELKAWMAMNRRKPSHLSGDDKAEAVLGFWLSQQHKYYERYQFVMKHRDIRSDWEDFVRAHARFGIYIRKITVSKKQQMESLFQEASVITNQPESLTPAERQLCWDKIWSAWSTTGSK